MTNHPAIRFDDGAAYEQMMGIWSRSAGEIFLDWLAPPPRLRWIDVGCGNGAFTELLVERCAPLEVQGIDPSEGQLAYARSRSTSALPNYGQGDAMALPFSADRFDAAVMALVLVFVPDPANGVAEMVRVVRPGGIVATYMWDMFDRRSPLDIIHDQIRAMGVPALRPPRIDASRLEALRDLWTNAGLEDIETKEIRVSRTFASFDEFWAVNIKSPAIGPTLAAMPPADRESVKARVRATLTEAEDGKITREAYAHAVRGILPG